MKLSKKNCEILEYISSLNCQCMPEDERPIWIEPDRLVSLCDDNLLMLTTLVPPGKEGYVKGLAGYVVTPHGRDALDELHQFQKKLKYVQAKKKTQKTAHEIQRKNDIRQSFLRDLVIMLLGAGIAYGLEHGDVIIQLFKNAVAWFDTFAK